MMNDINEKIVSETFPRDMQLGRGEQKRPDRLPRRMDLQDGQAAQQVQENHPAGQSQHSEGQPHQHWHHQVQADVGQRGLPTGVGPMSHQLFCAALRRQLQEPSFVIFIIHCKYNKARDK